MNYIKIRNLFCEIKKIKTSQKQGENIYLAKGFVSRINVKKKKKLDKRILYPEYMKNSQSKKTVNPIFKNKDLQRHYQSGYTNDTSTGEKNASETASQSHS